jgi:hypothetical protein
MRRFWWLAILLPGCLDGGQSGTENDPPEVLSPTCTEEESIVLANLTQIPEGMSISPQKAIELSGGLWQGSLVSSTSSSAPLGNASMTLTYAGGAVRLIRSNVEGFTAEGEFVSAPSDDQCPPRYEIPMTVTLDTADGSLNETKDVTLSASDVLFTFVLEVPLAEVVGTSRPQSFDPADFDATTLFFAPSLLGVEWQGEVSWSATREDPTNNTVTSIIENVGSLSLTK